MARVCFSNGKDFKFSVPTRSLVDGMGKVYGTIVCPATRENPRNTEADILELKDGRLLLAYTDFYHRSGHDMAPARISGKISSNGGRTWSDPFTIQENVGKENVMEGNLLRLWSGEIASFYVCKNSEADCKPYMRKSFNEGKNWGEAVPIAKFFPGYFTINNDRVIQLGSGRLLVPVAYTPNIWATPHLNSFCFFSDDNGRTWFKGTNEVDLPGVGAEEPGLVELKDGSVLMILRTSLGYIYRSRSRDRGLTWTDPESMGLVAPCAPATIKRIPTTDDLLMVWNNTPGPRRIPLTAAVSKDEGKTWENLRDLETDERYTHAYTSVAFVDERALLTYWVHDEGKGLTSLKLKMVPIDWFYGKA